MSDYRVLYPPSPDVRVIVFRDRHVVRAKSAAAKRILHAMYPASKRTHVVTLIGEEAKPLLAMIEEAKLTVRSITT